MSIQETQSYTECLSIQIRFGINYCGYDVNVNMRRRNISVKFIRCNCFSSWSSPDLFKPHWRYLEVRFFVFLGELSL